MSPVLFGNRRKSDGDVVVNLNGENDIRSWQCDIGQSTTDSGHTLSFRLATFLLEAYSTKNDVNMTRSIVFPCVLMGFFTCIQLNIE